MPILETQNLSYVYGENTPFRVQALENVNLSIEKGELVGIIGHTGSGKSTLMQHLNGLVKPSSGKVLLDGADIHASKAATYAARFRVGLCFQYPEYQLFESTVYRDIAFGPRNMGLSKEQVDERVRRAASYLEIRDTWLNKSPFDLSGGEKRRVAIAGVLAMEPEILILDEPTAGLDPRGRAQIASLIENYRVSTGSTILIVSHSMDDVAETATRVLVMDNGAVALSGTVDEVFRDAAALERHGLDVPQITRVFLSLRARGVEVRTDIYTEKQARRELIGLFKKRGVLQ